MDFLEREDRVRSDPLTLRPTLVVSAEDTAYYGQLRDFIPRRVLPFDYCFKLLYGFRVASLVRIQTRETYGFLTTTKFLQQTQT